MKVIFTGDPAELEAGAGLSRLSTAMFGKVFPMGAEVDVSDLPQDQLRKLLGNPHFREAGVDGPRAPFIIPASAAAARAEVQSAESAAAGADAIDEEEAAEAKAHAERAAAKKAKKG